MSLQVESGRYRERFVSRGALGIIVAIALIGTLAHAWMGHSWTSTSGHAIGSDDAYISYRYARNFFEGHGLVFNPGERVEGYSNFFYTILMVPAFLYSVDSVYTYSTLVNGFLLSLTLCLFWKHMQSRFSDARALAATFLLAASPWVWANAATGLETTFILAVTTVSWIQTEECIRTRSRSSSRIVLIACTLSVFGRVDGFILPAAVALYAFLKGEKALSLKLIKLLAVLAIGYTAFRYLYYHDVIANTYYNKISGDLLVRMRFGIVFVADYTLKTGFWIPLLAVLVLLALAIKERSLRETMDFATFFIILWLGYLVWIGGDIYFERFLVALFPMGIYVVFRLLEASRSKVLWSATIVLFAVCQSAFAFKDARFAYAANKYDCWVTTGKFLGQKYPGATVAVDAAGKIPYFSNLVTIDMLGLNDRHIGKMHIEGQSFYPGHSKFDSNYVMSRKPHLIAAWINPDQNLAWGLVRSLYSKQYILKYLVNSTRKNRAENNIIDVSQMPQDAIAALIRDEYNYAILIRR